MLNDSSPAARSSLLGLLTLCVFHCSAALAEPVLVPASHQAILFSPTVRNEARALVEVAQNEPERLLEALTRVATLKGLDPVARDAAIYDFVRRVRADELPMVDAKVLQWLREYQPQAERLHDESPAYRVPLFNVPAAALGLANQIEFETARQEWLLGPGDISVSSIEVFVRAPHSPRAAGYRSALRMLDAEALARLDRTVRAHPELYASAVYPALALARGRLDELADWLPGADTAQASFLLLETIRELPRDDAVSIHLTSLEHPDNGIRALGLAALSETASSWPPERKEQWLDTLADLLADPALGSAAALQLGRLAEPQWLKALSERLSQHPNALRRLELLESMQDQGVMPLAETQR